MAWALRLLEQGDRSQQPRASSACPQPSQVRHQAHALLISMYPGFQSLTGQLCHCLQHQRWQQCLFRRGSDSSMPHMPLPSHPPQQRRPAPKWQPQKRSGPGQPQSSQAPTCRLLLSRAPQRCRPHRWRARPPQPPLCQCCRRCSANPQGERGSAFCCDFPLLAEAATVLDVQQHHHVQRACLTTLCRVVLSMLSREMQRSAPSSKVRRRSEIDRRLDSLVPAGRLKDSHTTTIVKVQLLCSRAQHSGKHDLQAGPMPRGILRCGTRSARAMTACLDWPTTGAAAVQPVRHRRGGAAAAAAWPAAAPQPRAWARQLGLGAQPHWQRLPGAPLLCGRQPGQEPIKGSRQV